MSRVVCDRCQMKDGVVATKCQRFDGEEVELHLCQDCYSKLLYSKYWFETSQGTVKLGNKSMAEVMSGGNWTKLAKTINYAAFIADIVLGLIIGGFIGSLVSYEEGAGFLGAIVGGLIGLLIGGITIAFSMVFIEISEKLTSIFKEIKNISTIEKAEKEFESMKPETATEGKCPNCGADITPEEVFCTSCGEKL
ncbi:MAG: zinc ribbon domain-containing protein [Clostridia bacterium]|nr:zinc ribbon domain-containing protein [Clostridia bacterium]